MNYFELYFYISLPIFFGLIAVVVSLRQRARILADAFKLYSSTLGREAFSDLCYKYELLCSKLGIAHRDALSSDSYVENINRAIDKIHRRILS